MEQSVNYMGLKLKNPIVVAAGPWSKNSASIQKAIDAGAAAVTTETITMESSSLLYPRVYEQEGELLNTTLYSTLPFDAWEEELEKIEKKGSYVICNMRGNTPSEAAYVAKRLERWDADALELCPFTPIGTKIENVYTDADIVYEMLKAVTDAVSIPVTVRVPTHLACSPGFVKALEKGGASSISTIETMKALFGVDIERCRSTVPTFGGYSGKHIFPVTLATVATLAQLTNLKISAMGGVRNYYNIIECIMLGASVVQIGSGIMLHGYDLISETVQHLLTWMDNHQYASYEDICGIALDSLSTYEDLDSKVLFAAPVENVTQFSLEKLQACKSICLNHAIVTGNQSCSVNRSLCDGCGLCASLYPDVFRMISKII